MEKAKNKNPNRYVRLICPSCFFPVEKTDFLSKIEEWGVKVEGLNAPLPPEEMWEREEY